MDSQSIASEPRQEQTSRPASSFRLAGLSQKLTLAAWGVITLLGLFSFALSTYTLNVWDRVPAADPQYLRLFPDMTASDIQYHAEYQNVVLQAGLSLAGYALIFTVARLIGSLAVFFVGFLIIRRHGDRLMAIGIAILLSVFGAAGPWGNPLWVWAAAVAPWIKYPVALLGWLLWCGVIVLYTFPDGRFTPRWTLWLAVLVVPLSFFLAFDLNIFLNPGHWPDPLPLLPNILFIGGGLVAVVYRYWRLADAGRRWQMRGYLLGLLPILALYFADFFINEIYPSLAGQPLIQGNGAGMTYALVEEPLWYACLVVFAVGLASAVFRHNFLEVRE